ncbi:MAG: hypothetical protein ABWY06_17100 [Pseudomonas sp.]|uniref:hypothetical protein n=1 Tax=Pseudomonas sp. TaxID=306 RepID=UPI00339784EE
MKKFLPKAIALAVSLGAAASANATNVNSDGLGEVLLYPAYTVQEGNDTAISVTNTTNQIKAVKVRFLEGMNSQEVLDFNLYLSPFDVWNGVVVRTDAGAKLVTQDKSCTAPAIPAGGVEFRNLQYAGTDYAAGKGGPQGTDRTRIGHVELIEMGVVDPQFLLAPGVNAASAIVHTAAGVPGNCAAVSNAFKVGGIWAQNVDAGISTPVGGLYGVGTVTDVNEGAQIGYDATALADFSVAPSLHQLPGSLLPSLNNGVSYATFSDGTAADFPDSVDAVSAVLAKTALYNEFATESGVDAKSDWVVTFPTKYEYVNVPAANLVADQPFVNKWSAAVVGTVAGSSCQPIGLQYWDREEQSQAAGDIDFSPTPVAGGIALCFETNVISFDDSNVLAGTGDYVHFKFPVERDAGWAQITFTDAANVLTGVNGTVTNGVFAPTAGNVNVFGLPAIGFSMIKVSNGELQVDGKSVLSNYSAAWDHKASTLRVRP